MNIYAGNLSWNLKDQDLQNLFAEHGEVSSAKIVTDKFTGRSKGFGFVEMPDDSQAMAAINGLNETELDGRTIVVKKAEPRENSGRDNFRGGNDRRGGFRNDHDRRY